MISVRQGVTDNYRNGFFSVFGDGYDFIDKITGTASEIFEIYDGERFCGGLCIFDVSLKHGYSIKSGAYIYGAFILPSERGRGLFKHLIGYVREFYENEFYDFLLTIPAEASLFSLYEGLGFTATASGVISLLGDETSIILPQGASLEDFDGDFKSLYFIHIESDTLVKTFDIFKASVDDFEIKYLTQAEKRIGYALFDGDILVYASGKGVLYSGAKKGLLMPLTDFDCPNCLLCDILFEI
ncbi:MAG: hypothetical protein IJZ04_06975 [Clostridia bacterium]|nr:hypothetical protein [Clostridia bacterium]